MVPLSPLAERSLHRSRVRANILLALLRDGPSFLGQIERATGHDAQRLGWALGGHPPEYAVEESLLHLGLVRAYDTGRGTLFELTDAGRAEALALRARERSRVR
jgi:predicted transcriptional regulator with HTH domain